MNFPFRFAAADANDVLVLNDETANLILAGLAGSSLTTAQKNRFQLLGQRIIPSWLYAITLSATDDCTVEFGVYDGANFIGVYPVALLAAGSNDLEFTFNTGFAIPFGGAFVPAIKVITGMAVVLCGHAEFIPNVAEKDDAPIAPAASLGAGTYNPLIM